MRLFIGTFVSQTSRDRVESFQARNSQVKANAKLRWVAPEKLHLTWNFLGDVPEAERPELQSVIDKALSKFADEQRESSSNVPGNCLALPAVSLTVPTLWPDSRQPRIFVLCSSETSHEFDRLANLLREATVKFCRRPVTADQDDERSFKPHVTIARTPPNERAAKLRIEDFVELKSLLPLHLEIAKVELICSHFGNDARGYVPLATFSVNKFDKA